MKIFHFFIIIELALWSASASAAKSNVGSHGGRYQLIQLSDMRRDQYLIDTETGKLWTATCAIPGEGPDCELSYWSEELILGKNITHEQIKSMVREHNKEKSK